MADGSVAPKERVNIVYKSQTGDVTEEVELPLKMLVVGDFTGKESDTVIEDRNPININKDNFDDVVKNYSLNMTISIPNKLEDDAGSTEEITADLKFDTIKDFSPQRIAEQVPELNELLELRKALLALKGPLGNVPAFRKTIESILTDSETRAQITTELGIGNK
ncbi:MAG: type VI secretion system contractile sheath small subunit [Ectothiorhodospiraceae bacterium]|nr:type VI secretion system contractile sheath small subunit [Ectothiorhodospiraceae bacterium]